MANARLKWLLGTLGVAGAALRMARWGITVVRSSQ